MKNNGVIVENCPQEELTYMAQQMQLSFRGSEQALETEEELESLLC